MLTQVLFFTCCLAAILAMPAPRADVDEDIPVYTEKVMPAKPTRTPKFNTGFGAKKARLDHAKLANPNPHAPIPKSTLHPKAQLLKVTKPIRASKRPMRRVAKPARYADDLEYDAPSVSYAPHVSAPQEHYAPRVSAPQEHYAPHVSSPQERYAPVLLDEDVPRRLQHAAVGNAPQRVYAPAPESFYAAPAEVKAVPEYGYSHNSYEEQPQPYAFGYELKDEYGSTQSRREEGDHTGSKRGSYGYTDGNGIYRQVDYVADEHGFRAVVKTNEPGTENQDPADVHMQSEAEKY